MEKTFIIDEKHKRIIRSSNVEYDKTFLDYLCSINTAGYVSKEMDSESESQRFHSEIALCNPMKLLKPVGLCKYDPDEIKTRVEHARLIDKEQERLKKYKSRRRKYGRGDGDDDNGDGDGDGDDGNDNGDGDDDDSHRKAKIKPIPFSLNF